MTFFFHIGVVIVTLVVYADVTVLLGMLMSFGDADKIMPWAWLHGAIAFLLLAIAYLQKTGAWV